MEQKTLPLCLSPAKKVDEAMEIRTFPETPTLPFSCALGTLNGTHGLFRHKKGTRAYLVLEGAGFVSLGKDRIAVKKMDMIPIPPGVAHGIEGDLQVLILDSPPFDPEDETSVEKA